MTIADKSISSQISDHINSVPIEELELPKRAHNALKRWGIDTLGQILFLGEDGVAGIRNVGPQVLDMIFEAIALYLGLSRASLVSPESLNDARPTIETKRTPMTETKSTPSPFIGELQHVLQYPISVLTLSNRGRNCLHKAGIATIGDLWEARRVGLGRIRLVGEKTAGEIETALDDFCNHPRRFTDDEIESLSDSRKNLIAIKDLDGQANLVSLIVQISKNALLKSGNDREYEVLKRRYGLEGSDTYTLKEIGDFFEVTRERIRQIESKAIGRIRNVLINNSDKDFRVPQNLVFEANNLRAVFASSAGLMTENEIKAVLQQRYDTPPAVYEIGAIRLMLDVFGFSPIAQNVIGVSHELVPSWLLNEDLDRSLLREALIAVSVVLHESVAPLSFFDLKVRVNRQKATKITNDYIRFAATIDDTIEILPQDTYQIRFVALPSVADKVYRILYERKMPMDIRSLHREMGHRLTKAGRTADVTEQNLKNRLVSDQRFAPIGRSGRWSLSEWTNIRKDTILDLMKEFFHLQQRAATVDEVYEYVIVVRPDVSKHTIVTYLAGRTDLFTKVSSGMYELAAWGSEPFESRPRIEASESLQRLTAALEDIFSGESPQAMSLSRLVQLLTDRTGIPSSTIRTRLAQMSCISLEPDPERPRTKLVRYTDVVSPSPSMREAPKASIGQSIQDAVESYLMNEPECKALLANVAGHAIRVTGCKKSTFYRYLSKSDNIDKTMEGGRMYCLLRTKAKVTVAMPFPLAETILDLTLKQNIGRAIANLNIDNIDMGLFYLGKIFENELRTFLVEAQSAGIYVVSNKDLARLASMIDWLERNAIVREKHHLTLLREQRNERAHGEIPDHQERERLMRHAPFLGDLYIKYISLFRQKSEELRNLKGV